MSVKEGDGSVEVFSVPYASVAQLLRPGMTRYALSAGKVDDSSLRNKPMLYQGTWQHGLNNLFTGYTGVTGFDDYQGVPAGDRDEHRHRRALLRRDSLAAEERYP
ncbi:fimbria/pilus outer membrane usher protein [Klebsiella pneumoniae subsp. pneumoniae]|nr:fimbria/pilus outer membrane usher protein [Klebsiella pneumoniae subsp. pneumoniae]